MRLVMRSYPFPRGQGRIIDRSFLRRLKFPETELIARTSDGFRMTIWPNDHIGRHIYLTGQFDRTIVEVLLKYSRKGDVVLDIGAHIGYVSCALLHNNPSCTVVAVEPRPDCFRLLCDNLTAWKQRSTALQAAVSDRDGTGRLVIDERNTGKSHLAVSPRELADRRNDKVEVPLLTGASLMRRVGFRRLDLIKIDVEGHEERVIRTLEPLINAHQPRAIVFEHFGNLSTSRSSLRQVIDALGYEIFAIQKGLTRWRLVPVGSAFSGARRSNDFVALPGAHLLER